MITKRRKIIQSNSCPEFNIKDSIILTRRGDVVCRGCGLVLSEKMIDIARPGVRYFTTDEMQKRARTGPPILDFESQFSLPTVIDFRKVRDPRKRQIYRKHTQFRSSREKCLQEGFYQLKRIATNLDLPKCVMKDAIKLFIEAQSKKLIYGYSYLGIAAACLYHESKKHHYTRPCIYFAEQIEVKGKRREIYFNKCYRRIIKGLCLPHLPISPVEYISLFIHRDESSILLFSRKSTNLLE